MPGRWILLVLAVTNILLFQNCGGTNSKFSPSSGSSASLPSNSNAATDNGQPYDGKVYVVLGEICSDGTQVRSRIVLNSLSSATLVRENCQVIAPLLLTSADFQLNPNDSNQLIFAGQTFTAEQPSVLVNKMVSWNYQLTGTATAAGAELVDLDMFSTSAAAIKNLKLQGHKVICNIPAGAFDPTSPDAASFNPSEIGNKLMNGSADRWLDTRSLNVRALLIARLDLAKSKGCEGIDFDSVDGYSSNSGFPLSKSTQLDFNRYLAFAAHDRGLIVALNNVADLAMDLVADFDFVVAEECIASGECAKYKPFTDLGKPVLDAEYTAFSAASCANAQALQISLTYFSAALDGSRRQTCP